MEHREHTINVGTGTMIRAIVVLLLFAMLFVLKNLVLVVLMAIVIASAIEPAVQWLVRHKTPRLLSVISVYLFLALSLICIVYFLVLPLLSESSDFLKNFPQYFNADTVSSTIAHNQFLSSQPIVAGLQNSVNLEQMIGQINDVITSFTSSAFNTVAAVFGGIFSFVLMIMLSFYLTVSEDGVGKFLKTISPLKHEKYIISLWRRTQRKIGLWMQGQLILAVIIGVLVYL